MSLWQQLGFRANPYDSRALPASPEGEQLLVGREQELRTLRSRLINSTLHPTIEGDNGVGKTSLVLVAGFAAMRDRREKKTFQLFLPVEELLQIGTDPVDFDRRALLAIAYALVDHRDFLRKCGIEPKRLGDLGKWMQDPIVRTAGGGGAQVLGVGADVTINTEVNTGPGFTDAGLDRLVREVLLEIFPTDGDGGMVAVIDNMELLSRSNEAKRVLERIRDTSLSIPRVRWVLCGAKGIVRASISSPRLTGRVATPIAVKPVPDEKIEQLIEARLSHFAIGATYKAPVASKEFRHLYDICNHNLRDALKYAQDFSLWLDEQDELNRPQEDMFGLLEVWLATEAETINQSISLQPRMWKLFDDLADVGGSCAPGDFEMFGFQSMQRMRSNFAELERADLVVAEIDEDDHRRRTVAMTPKGWLVHYSRNGFERTG